MINLKKNKLPNDQRILSIAAIIALTLAIMGGAYVWNKALAAQDAPERKLTANDVYAATFRALRVDKDCIDYSRDAILVHFSEYDELQEGETDKWLGWWYMKLPKFNYLPGNDTWFLEEIDDAALLQIYPSSRNHKCAERKDFEGK